MIRSGSDPERGPSGDAPHDLATIGVVGAGVMGAGIAQLALEAGHEVVLHDLDAEALARGRTRIEDGLSRRARNVVADSSETGAWVRERLDRLRVTDVLEQVADEADVVLEAAIESLELKRTIFGILDSVASPETILATNTSALSVGAIAAAAARSGRVLGLHFFNPAPVMRLVEVVAGPETTDDVVARASSLVSSWGRTPVRSTDTPGFIVNRVNRPFTLEALRMIEDGSASVEQVDQALRAAGYPLGPFELMDLTGIDVTFAAASAIWQGLGRPDRLRPSPIQEVLIGQGDLGRKSGQGFYRYPVDGQIAVSERFASDPGLAAATAITMRIETAIRAEAQLAAAAGVASPSDIDLALRLGAGHPRGPFSRAEGPDPSASEPE